MTNNDFWPLQNIFYLNTVESRGSTPSAVKKGEKIRKLIQKQIRKQKICSLLKKYNVFTFITLIDQII